MSRLGDPAIAELLREAADRAYRYVAAADDRRVAPSPEALEGLRGFAEALPDGPSDPRVTLALLDELGSPATVVNTGGRYFGFVIGGTLPVALASSWLAAAWDQNAALPVMSPVAAALHEVANRLAGRPPRSAARHRARRSSTGRDDGQRDGPHRRAGPPARPGRLGRPGRRPGRRPALTVVVGEKAHSTIAKSSA